MINNTAAIRALLKFPESTSFYFLEIIKRRKENPELAKHAKLIKDFYIYSFNEFDKINEQVIELCEEHNARAYFRLNLRDAKKIALQYNKRLAELLITEDYKNIPRSYAAVVGEFHHDPDKTWVIDVDKHEDGNLLHPLAKIYKRIANIREHTKQEGDGIVAELPTKNGVHIITRPFRLDMFKNTFSGLDVHKDNPTILYVP